LLSDFAKTYYPLEFDTIHDEFKLVKETECKLMEFCTNVSMAEELERIMRGDIVGEAAHVALEKTYRDHFIHSFQDFLTGTILLDKFYGDFNNWYSPSLNLELRTSVECSWLLTALFHDRFRPLLKLGELLGEKIPPGEDNSSKFACNLASFYAHLSTGKTLESWSPTDAESSSTLGTILLNHSNLGNHAARGAFTILGYDLPIAAPTKYAAALAIALHDGDPRNDLLGSKILPVKMEQFPLVVLLMYIDAAQEWNRTAGSKDELVDILLENNQVVFVMDFSSAAANSHKAQEFESIARCIISPISLGFASSFSIGSGSA
jgi:hypothetical protein